MRIPVLPSVLCAMIAVPFLGTICFVASHPSPSMGSPAAFHVAPPSPPVLVGPCDCLIGFGPAGCGQSQTMQWEDGPHVDIIEQGICDEPECENPRPCKLRIRATFTSSLLDCNEADCVDFKTTIHASPTDQGTGDPCASPPTEAVSVDLTLACEGSGALSSGTGAYKLEVHKKCKDGDGVYRWQMNPVDSCTVEVTCNPCPHQ